jgi:hypothetical protein
MTKTKLRRGEIEIDLRYERRMERLASDPRDDQPITALARPGPVTLAEQQSIGLARPARQNLVLPERTPATAYPMQPDQFIHLPTQANIVQSAAYTADPISRGWAMLIKTSAVTVFLAVLTLMGMLLWGLAGTLGAWLILWWLFVASLEWVVCFLVLATLDYKETPAAQNRYSMRRIINMMAVEQAARLIERYGSEKYEAATRAIRRARI